MKELNNKVAVITGGAEGIGKAIAQSAAKRGMKLVLADINAERLQATVTEFEQQGFDVLGVVTDVSKEAAIQHLADQAYARHGAVHLLVNNAGVAGSMTALEMTEAEWQRVMDTNVTGVFRFCQAEAAAMRQHGGGAIVNVASISGSIVNPGLTQTHYNTSKAALIHMSKSLAMEWVHDGIRVNAVSPGYTFTEMNQRVAVLPMLERFKSQTPMGRLADVDEIVGPTIFLLSDAASFITAHDLVVDGGLTAW